MNSEKKRKKIQIGSIRSPKENQRRKETKTKERRRTVQTLIPITGSDKRNEIQIGEERGEKGTDLPRRASECPCIGAREEEPSRPFTGAGEEELGQGGAAARPLDGGVLTRWGARAPARGPATAQRPARSSSLALGCSCAALKREERVRRRRERESRGECARVFQGTGRGDVLIRAKRTLGRRIKTDGRDSLGQLEAQAGVRCRGTLPAQAQVAAWVRPGRARGCWAEPVQRVLGRAGLKNERRTRNFFSYYFPETILNAYFDEFE